MQEMLEAAHCNIMRTKRNAHPEDFCSRCRRVNPVWHAPNELWNQVMRDGSAEPIICPLCFIRLAEAKGVRPASWRLSEK